PRRPLGKLAAVRMRQVAGTGWSSKECRNIGVLKEEPSALEPVAGAAQLKPKCERFWTLPGGVPVGRTTRECPGAKPEQQRELLAAFRCICRAARGWH